MKRRESRERRRQPRQPQARGLSAGSTEIRKPTEMTGTTGICGFYWQAPKHTRIRNTPENAGNLRAPQKGPENWCRTKNVEKVSKIFLTLFDDFDVAPFRRPLLRSADNRPFNRICGFRCVASFFFGCALAPLRGEQRAPENATDLKTQTLGTVRYLRFFGCVAFSGALCSPLSLEKPE